MFDGAESFYYQPEDDAVIPPPLPISSSGGGGGGKARISFEDAGRLKQQLREMEAHRRKQWKDKKEFEEKIEKIYRDLYETPYEAEATQIVEQVKQAAVSQSQGITLDYALVLQHSAALKRLLDLYQTFLDDEEAVALLLLGFP